MNAFCGFADLVICSPPVGLMGGALRKLLSDKGLLVKKLGGLGADSKKEGERCSMQKCQLK